MEQPEGDRRIVRPKAACWVAAVLVWIALAPLISRAGEDKKRTPSRQEVEEALPEGGTMTGREIYERFLDNRVRASFQALRVLSADPGGSVQETRFTVHVRDLRAAGGQAVDGILAKTLIQISHPFDLRHTAYLVIAKDPGPNDEFVYRPESRMVRRVELRYSTLLGTDYSFDDLGFQQIGDANYHRLPDQVVDGRRVFVVEAMIKDESESDYGRTRSYIEQEHYVPLRIRYWDRSEVETKEMTANAESIEQFGDVWVARESKMTSHLERTHSTMYVEQLEVDPQFHEGLFSLHRLARGH